MIRRSVLIIVVVWSCSLANADCPTDKPEDISKILSQGIDLSEQFKRSSTSSDKTYFSIRKKNEDYSESMAIPCFLVGSEILVGGLNLPLLRTMLEFAVSHENSADESIYEALNQVRDAYPEALASLVSSFPQSQADALMRTISDVGAAAQDGDAKTKPPCSKERNREE